MKKFIINFVKYNSYIKKVTSYIKDLWYKYIIFFKFKTVKIEDDEVCFVNIHNSLSFSDMMKIQNYLTNTLGDKVFVYKEPLFDFKVIKIEKDDVIIASVNKDTYTYVKSDGSFNDLGDRIKMNLETIGVDNKILLEPEGITYNTKEKELIMKSLKNEK